MGIAQVEQFVLKPVVSTVMGTVYLVTGLILGTAAAILEGFNQASSNAAALATGRR